MEKEEEEEEEEMTLKPQLTPQGSGGSGVLMGPDTQKGLKKHTPLGSTEHRVVLYIGRFQEGPCSSLGPWSKNSITYKDSNAQNKEALICS